jgi:hypothetical protein
MPSLKHPFQAQLLDDAGSTVTGAAFVWPGGQLCIALELSAGSVDIEYLSPSGTWIDIATLKGVNATGLQQIAGVPSGSIRAVTDNAGSGVTVWAILNVD